MTAAFRRVGCYRRPMSPMFGVMKAILGMPPLPRAWVMLLAAVNMASIAFIGYREAQVVLAAMMLGGIIMEVIYAKLGFVRLLGVAHFHWIPMLLWLYGRLDTVRGYPGMYYWILTLFAVNGISLVVDVIDVGRYVAGERAPTVDV